ncbi:hypothetical protein CEXT_549591, partial [Caerostris extrusa]
EDTAHRINEGQRRLQNGEISCNTMGLIAGSMRYRDQKYGNGALIKPAWGYLEDGIASANCCWGGYQGDALMPRMGKSQKYGNEALIKPAEGYLEGGIASAKLLSGLISRACANAQDVKKDTGARSMVMRLSLNLRRAISKVRYRGQKYGNEVLIKPAEGYLEGGIASAKLLSEFISRGCANAQNVKVTPCHTANVAASYQKNKTRHTALMRGNEDCRLLKLFQHYGIDIRNW